MTIVHQGFTPKYIRSRIAFFGSTQLVVADLADVDNSGFSLALNGFRGFSEEAQSNIFRVFSFFTDLQERSDGVPVDFTDIEKLRPLWRKWCAARDESVVIRTVAEQAAGEQE
jgi:hypothetical protein